MTGDGGKGITLMAYTVLGGAVSGICGPPSSVPALMGMCSACA